MPNKRFNFRFQKRKEVSAKIHTEPSRRNVLDNVLHNLKVSGRVVSLHRIIYIAEHTFPHPEVAREMKHIIEKENSESCDELLTGIFLYYPKYFCHLIEASEQTLKNHINVVFTNPLFQSKIVKCKVLNTRYHINQRMINNWTEHAGKAPTLLEQINPEADITVTMANIQRCVTKLYKLGLELRPMDLQYVDSANKIIDYNNFESNTGTEQIRSSFPNVLTMVQSTVSMLDVSRKIGELLPESQLLDFLLKSPYLNDIYSFHKNLNVIPSMILYQDVVVPVQQLFLPRDTFNKEFNPITKFVHLEEDQDNDNTSTK